MHRVPNMCAIWAREYRISEKTLRSITVEQFEAMSDLARRVIINDMQRTGHYDDYERRMSYRHTARTLGHQSRRSRAAMARMRKPDFILVEIVRWGI